VSRLLFQPIGYKRLPPRVNPFASEAPNESVHQRPAHDCASGRLVPGRPGGYPTRPPTDPDERNSRIRFLGDQSLGTTLAQNSAARQTCSEGVDDSGDRERVPRTQPVERHSCAGALATPTQPVAPRVLGRSKEGGKPRVIAPDAIVLEVPA